MYHVAISHSYGNSIKLRNSSVMGLQGPFQTGWFMKKRGLKLAFFLATLNDDRWYTSHRPFYFVQKDIVGHMYHLAT